MSVLDELEENLGRYIHVVVVPELHIGVKEVLVKLSERGRLVVARPNFGVHARQWVECGRFRWEIQSHELLCELH